MTDGRTRRVLLAGAAGLAGSLAGCSLVGGPAEDTSRGTTVTAAPVPTVEEPVTVDTEAERDLTVAHWLQDPDERAAFEAMADPFRAEIGVDVRPPGGRSVSFTRNGMAERVERGYPPGIWQTDPGARLAWPVERDLLWPVAGAVWRDRDVRLGYPDALEALATFGGRHVAVPWHGERLNNLFFDPRVFDRAGLDPAAVATGDLLDVVATVAAETDATPIVQSTGAPWQVGQLFEALVIAQDGGDTFRRLLAGWDDDLTRPAVREALGTVADLAEHFPSDTDEIDRGMAVERVLDGTAAMTVAGDRAVGGPAAETGFAARSDARYGEDWDRVSVPGTGEVFLFTTTSFVAPRNNPTPDLSRSWLEYVAGPAAQQRFCTRSGTVPLRFDVDPGPLPAFARSQFEDYRRLGARLPSLTHGLAVPEAGYRAFLTAIYEFTGDWAVERAADRILAAVGGENETPSPRDRRR